MGVNNTGQQPTTPQGLMQQNALQKLALSPYQGTAPNGGMAQGAAQLAAALMAHSKFGNTQNRFQRPAPGVMPAAVTQIQTPTLTPPAAPDTSIAGLPGIASPLQLQPTFAAPAASPP